MILTNVSFGIFAFMPQGWIFMAFVILIECLGLSYLLTKGFTNRKIYITVILSNVLSGFIGGLISILLNGGWWLVIWIPWVSNNEVDIRSGLNDLIIYYTFAFILTVFIETMFNLSRIINNYHPPKIIYSTLLINIITYLVGSIVLYSYSFR